MGSAKCYANCYSLEIIRPDWACLITEVRLRVDLGCGVAAFELLGLILADLWQGKLVSSAKETSVKKLRPESFGE